MVSFFIFARLKHLCRTSVPKSGTSTHQRLDQMLYANLKPSWNLLYLVLDHYTLNRNKIIRNLNIQSWFQMKLWKSQTLAIQFIYLPPKMHRNQRASRVPAKSQIKAPHKTLKYIIVQNFYPHVFRAEFIFFKLSFPRWVYLKQISIHTCCERTLLILTQLYAYITFPSNYTRTYVIIFLY